MTYQPQTIKELQAEAIAAAVELFEGDVEAAELWLNTPLRAIGHEKPSDYMDTPDKVRTLKNIIGRLEHGVWT